MLEGSSEHICKHASLSLPNAQMFLIVQTAVIAVIATAMSASNSCCFTDVQLCQPECMQVNVGFESKSMCELLPYVIILCPAHQCIVPYRIQNVPWESCTTVSTHATETGSKHNSLALLVAVLHILV